MVLLGRKNRPIMPRVWEQSAPTINLEDILAFMGEASPGNRFQKGLYQNVKLTMRKIQVDRGEN